MNFDEGQPPFGSRGRNLLMLMTLLGGIGAGPVVAQPPSSIERLAWLQGCWVLSTPGRDIEEHWMAPKGTSILGIARTIRGGTLVEYEMMLIRETADRVVFEARPSDQPAALFNLIEAGTTRIVFENPAHDFPQRIGYERKGRSLLAWIEGTQDGKPRRIEFPYLRTSCGPA
jgi:hypothetical protein